MTEESAVKVCVRVRPLVEREENAAAATGEPVQLFWRADSKSIHPIDDAGNTGKSFSFDRVFTAEERTDQLYRDIAKPLVVSTVGGYNGTIFAYGQTCSGKTFTMMGSDHAPGVIPLAMEDVFQTITTFPNKEFLLRVSYMEIYNETVTDLLVDRWKRKPLEVREGMNKSVYVADLTEEVVTSSAQVLAWIRKGEKNRRYGKTKMNQRSSRSHTIFRMILESRERSDPASSEGADGAIIVSNLNLVDLAGSERASQTGAEGERLKEGCNINRSLFTLSQVIKKLTDESQTGYINYRDSKLTRILQNSLGGNAKTVIVCTVTPASLDETLSTLQFACTAKKMKNDPHVTEVSDDGALLKRYRNEIVDLKRRLHEVSSVTQTTATEKEVLSQLLQEKDQLQREQEDRIRNLTKLLVTGPNLVPVHKIPKRRVTWGGKMLRLSQPSASESAMSDQSLAEPFSHRRKRKQQLLNDVNEDEEFFDPNWGIPEEPSDDMEYSQTSMSVWSFGDSPKEHVSPGRICELSEEVSSLKQQLEAESRQRGEDMKTVEVSKSRVADLELQLQTEAQQKTEALEKMQTAEQKVSDLELQLQTEAQQKMEALQKMQTAEQKVSDLELQLQTEAQQKMEALQKMQTAEQKVSDLELQLQTEAQQKMEALQKMQTAEQKVSDLELQLQTEAQQKMEALQKMQTAEQKVSDLELQLQTEAQQKMEALEKMQTAEQKVSDLELQLQTDAQQKMEALEKMQTAEQKVSDLELQLQTEAQQKMESTERLQLRVAELELQLEEQSSSDAYDHMKREFAEAIQLCDTLTSDKDLIAAERDSLKQELSMFMDQMKHLEREKAALSKELKEMRDLEEFNTLEDGFRKEQENEFRNQISVLEKALESAELQRVELQNKLQTVSEELRRKSEYAEELQNLSGKSLVQEVAELRRSLDDAEGLSRDTKKEWAVLRSQNISLLELNASLSSSQEKMEAELRTLRLQLEKEKSRNRKMQSDLQKELNVAFDENTKLTSLLDGKVPKDLIDSLELERRSAATIKELMAARQVEEALKAQLEELQALPDKVDSLMKQLEGLSEKLRGVQAERDGLQSAQAQSQLEEQQLREALQSREEELQRIQASLSSHQQNWEAERIQLLASLEDLEEKAAETQVLLESLENQLQDEKQRNWDLQEEMLRVSQELQVGGAQSTALEVERLLSDVAAVTEERDQLKEDMKENVDMMIETQAELRAALENNREQKKKIKLLEAAQAAKVESSQLEELQTKVSSLSQELTSLQLERDRLQSEQTSSSAQEEQLLRSVTALTEERDQLQEILEGVREEKRRLREELEEQMEMAVEAQGLLHSVQQQLQEQMQSLHVLHTTREEEQSLLKQQLSETTALLQSVQEELKEQQQTKLKQMREFEQRESDLKHQLLFLTEELEKAEKNNLTQQGEDGDQRSSKEEEELLLRVTVLREERDQLQQELREEKRLKGELEGRMEMLQAEISGLKESLQTIGEQRRQLEEDLQHSMDLVSSGEALLQSVQEELKEQQQTKVDQMREFEQRESDLKLQLMLLTEELEKAEKINLSYQGEDGDQRSSKEEEELLLRVTVLREERDQLQQELREEKRLKGELEGRMEMLQAEISGLKESLQTIGEQRRQLEEDLQHSMDLVSSGEALLQSVQEELKEQKNIYSDLQELLQEKESSFMHQMLELSGRLESAEAEWRSLLCGSQKLTEEKEELLRSVTSLKEDNQRLGAQMRDLQQELIQQEQLEMQRTSEREEDSRQHRELLIEANRNLSALKQQLLTLEQKSREKEEEKQEVLPSRLQESNRLLQESFGKLQELIDSCREHFSVPLDPALGAQCSLIHPYMDSLPKASVDVYRSVQWQGRQTVLRLQSVQRQLQARAISSKRLLEVLVKKEEAVFEERRLQDLLLCRTQAPDCDLQALWERRRGELLDRRQLHQQEMENILERFWAHMESHMLELRAEIAAREKFREQLQAAVTRQPIVLSELDGGLQCELERRSAAATYSAAALEFVEGEKVRFDELKRQAAQTESLLREEKSKTCTLLQALEGAPLKTEVSLLKDNQELYLQLQEAQENIKALRVQMEQLQEAQACAHSRLSSHKEATQLLQTELQDSRALVQEKEGAIQTLRSKLRESEKRASPAAEDLENLKKKLFQMEVKFTSMSEEHKQEIQKMSSMLSIKEDSLRRLKEDLRRAQQRGEESFLQGEDLHAKLTNPKGLVVRSSILLEKTKLEEEVKQLQLKITELESLVSSQQAEVAKWKNRAIKLKNKTEMDEPPLPSTTSKRPPPMTADFNTLLCSPKKILLTSNKMLASPLKGPESPSKPLDSPKSSLFRSPKSRFFDAGGASEVLSRNRPKQFFDNSALGTTPDAAAGASGTDPWWPQSPKKEDFCKTQ
ncbi:centromere-associated protein E isoform X3 [Oryzias latipes]|nr:centromere-associated protein E isoform X3 [Oryzias latipes]